MVWSLSLNLKPLNRLLQGFGGFKGLGAGKACVWSRPPSTEKDPRGRW